MKSKYFFILFFLLIGVGYVSAVSITTINITYDGNNDTDSNYTVNYAGTDLLRNISFFEKVGNNKIMVVDFNHNTTQFSDIDSSYNNYSKVNNGAYTRWLSNGMLTDGGCMNTTYTGNLPSTFYMRIIVNVSDLSNNHYFVSKLDSGINNRSWNLGYTTATGLRFATYSTGATTPAEISNYSGVTQNQTYDIVVVYGATQTFFYVDGILRNTTTRLTNTIFQSNLPLVIGGGLTNNVCAFSFNKTIDYFELGNGTVTSEQITEWHSAYDNQVQPRLMSSETTENDTYKATVVSSNNTNVSRLSVFFTVHETAGEITIPSPVITTTEQNQILSSWKATSNYSVNLTLAGIVDYNQIWWYFNITNIGNRSINYTVTNADQSSMLSTTTPILPVFSCDNENWSYVNSSRNISNIFSFVLNTTCNTVKIALTFPTSYNEMITLSNLVNNSVYGHIDYDNLTKNQSRLIILKITNSTSLASESQKKKVAIITDLHGNGEGFSPHITEGLINYLLNDTDTTAKYVRDNYVYYIVPNANPDAIKLGITFTNAQYRDLNDWWNETNDYEIVFMKNYFSSVGTINFMYDLHTQGGDSAGSHVNRNNLASLGATRYNISNNTYNQLKLLLPNDMTSGSESGNNNYMVRGYFLGTLGVAGIGLEPAPQENNWSLPILYEVGKSLVVATYNVLGNSSYNSSCVTLNGSNTFINNTILCSGVYNNASFYGNVTPVIKLGTTGNFVLDCDGARIVGVNATNSVGINTGGVRNWTVKNCIIDGYATGINNPAFTTYSKFMNNYITNTMSGITTAGGDASNLANVSYTNNTIVCNRAGYGLQITIGDNHSIINNTIINCTHGNGAIYYSNNNNLIMKDNIVLGNGNISTYIRYSNNTLLQNNNLSCYYSDGSSCVYYNGNTNSTFINNKVSESRHCVYIFNNNNMFNFSNNNVFNCDEGFLIQDNNVLTKSYLGFNNIYNSTYEIDNYDVSMQLYNSSNIDILNQNMTEISTAGIIIRKSYNINITNPYCSAIPLSSRSNYLANDVTEPAGICIGIKDTYKMYLFGSNNGLGLNDSFRFQSVNITLLNMSYDSNIQIPLIDANSTNLITDLNKNNFRMRTFEENGISHPQTWYINPLTLEIRNYQGTNLYSNPKFISNILKIGLTGRITFNFTETSTNIKFKNVNTTNNKNLSIYNALLNYPYNDIKLNGVLNTSNVNNYSLTLTPNQQIEVGDFVRPSFTFNSPPSPTPGSLNTVGIITLNGTLNDTESVVNYTRIQLFDSFGANVWNFTSNRTSVQNSTTLGAGTYTYKGYVYDRYGRSYNTSSYSFTFKVTTTSSTGIGACDGGIAALSEFPMWFSIIFIVMAMTVIVGIVLGIKFIVENNQGNQIDFDGYTLAWAAFYVLLAIIILVLGIVITSGLC